MDRTSLGVLLGLGAAAAFALNTIFIRIGMRGRPRDDGFFITIGLNTVILGIAAVVAPSASFTRLGLTGFVLAGLAHSLVARWSTYRAIRFIGPSRQGVIQMTSPGIAAVIGWVALGEELTPLQGVGGAVVLAALALVVSGRTSAPPIVAVDASSGGPTPSDGDVSASERHIFVGFCLAGAAATFFAIGFVLRRWALLLDPYPVPGGFVGMASTFVLVLFFALVRPAGRDVLSANVRHIPWPFFWAGIAASAALLMQFGSSLYLPAWVATLMHATQALWILIWSKAILGGEERIDARLVVASMLLAVGAFLIVSPTR